MRDFFHGWRRKVGCVLLVMALVFILGWIRSRQTQDVIVFPMGPNLDEALSSGFDSLVWVGVHEDTRQQLWSSTSWESVPAKFNPLELPDMNWRWRFAGFGVYTERVRLDTATAIAWVVPYWAIVISLTLLSAYLILRPGKRPERQTKAPPD